MTVSWTLACAGVLALAVIVAPARSGSARPLFSPLDMGHNGTEVAYALELIALALEGGAPVPMALAHVAETSANARVREVLTRVCAGLQWGLDGPQSWQGAPPEWAPAVRAFTLAGRAGAAPSQLLRAAAADVRHAETERVTTAGAKAGVYIVLPLGLCFLPAFLLITVVPLVLGLLGTK